MSHLFCFGLGYSAVTLANRLLKEGWRVSGTCRTSAKCEELRVLGITAYIFDNDLPLEEIWDLGSVTHILHSIPPHADQGGDAVLLHHLDNLKALRNLEWMGYLSTTGVYGNHDGAWVNEDTPVNPPAGRSTRRVETETMWLDTGLPVHIFRLSGIYGSGRNVLEELKAGTVHRIYKEKQVFSRIHVEDVANILQCSIKKLNPGRIYNCADDLPEAQHIVVEYAANLLNIDAPPLIPYEDAALSDFARSFWVNNRRVSNARIKHELQVRLKYPSYKQGLEACMAILAC